MIRSNFIEAVVDVVLVIPAGEVLTYGEVAIEAGYSGAARAVGGVLASSGGTLPWWRVVAASGRLVPGNEIEHAGHLRAEAIALRQTPAGTFVVMSTSRRAASPLDR